MQMQTVISPVISVLLVPKHEFRIFFVEKMTDELMFAFALYEK